VAYHDEDESIPSRRDGRVNRQIAKPIPEEELACDLEVAVPPCRAFVRPGKQDEMCPGEAVEIESAHCENGVVKPVLIVYRKLRKGVITHNAFVVGASQTLEEAVRDGEERHMFNVGVVLGRVGHDVVYIVISLPPAYA
jgi:hypothetical protein